MNYPEKVCLVEVGPRDGLQNEATALTVAQKATLVDKLSASGLPVIETGSFVSSRWVPQMADSASVFSTIHRLPGVRYTALTPNERGLDAAIEANVTEVAIFAGVTESFSHRNLNAGIQETLQRFEPVLARAGRMGMPVRGYLSCVLGCPYEGKVAPEAVSQLTRQLLESGCYEVSLGDTIGTGTAGSTVLQPSMHPLRASVAVPMRWVQAAMWQPRMLSTCSTDLASNTVSTCPCCSRPVSMSVSSFNETSSRVRPEPCWLHRALPTVY